MTKREFQGLQNGQVVILSKYKGDRSIHTFETKFLMKGIGYRYGCSIYHEQDFNFLTKADVRREIKREEQRYSSTIDYLNKLYDLAK